MAIKNTFSNLFGYYRRYRYVIIGVIFVLIFLIVYVFVFPSKPNIENFTKNIEYHNFLNNELPVSTKKMFNEIVKNVPQQNIQIYSVFGDEPNLIKQPNTLYIQYSAESFYYNPELFDINFIPTDNIQKNVVIFPYGFYHLLENETDIHTLTKQRIYNKKTEFCLFVVSNPDCEQRNKMFSELSKYKNIDSCGKHMNNMTCPENWTKEYYDFIQKYKFMICFENVAKPYYLTEKIINAYTNGSIPIYWGCPNISNYINMDAILYLPPDYTEEDMKRLIREIEYLDNNEDAYRRKYESVFFKNGNVPDDFNLQQIKEKVEEIANSVTK